MTMFGLFNYDGPVVQTLNKVADGICLSVLWLISCLPLVTAGAATTALYYSVNKCIRHGEGHIWHEYWHAFLSNFKQATLLWLPLALIYGAIGASCYSCYLMCSAGNLPKEMLYFLLIVSAVITAWGSLPFPYLARFQNTNRMILKNCLGIALMNLPVTLLHLIFLALALAMVVIFPLTILCAPGIYMILSCYALEPVFRKYMSPEDREKEEKLDEEA